MAVLQFRAVRARHAGPDDPQPPRSIARLRHRQRHPGTFARRRSAWTKARFIPPCTAWKRPDGSRRSGKSRRTNGARGSIALIARERSNSRRKPSAGAVSRPVWRGCCVTRSGAENHGGDIVSWLSRFKNALNPRRLDEDLADEMRDHMERRAEDLRGRGLSARGGSDGRRR